MALSTFPSDPYGRLLRWLPFSTYDSRRQKNSPRLRSGGFSLVETIAAISLAGLGVTTTVAALTKLNEFANTSRSVTGAYAAAMNQVDAIQSAAPFRPSETPPQIPAVLKVGTTTNDQVIYGDSQAGTTNVTGIVETTVQDVSSGKIPMYRATVTVSWQYRGGGPVWSGAPRNRWEYQVKVNTLRASDQ